jgi:hypothetical protein
MHVIFVQRAKRPDRLVADVELVFDSGPLTGTKLVGTSIWRSPTGEQFVTFPARGYAAGTDRRFYDFLRSADGTSDDVRRVKQFILDEYKRSRLERTA